MRRLPGRPRARAAFLAALALFASTVFVAFAMTTGAPLATTAPAALYTAFSEVEVCDGPGACSLVEISLASDWDGEGGILCVTSTTGPLVEHGCATVDQSFGLGTDAITWAAVPATLIDLYETRCNDRSLCQDVLMRTLELEGLWAGEGEMLQFDQSFGRHYGACTWPDDIGGYVRTASLDLRVDGDPIRAFGNIRVMDATNIPTTTCAGFGR
jgi:hypothetical protein